MRNLTALILLSTIATGNAFGDYVYSLTDLGRGEAYGINDKGQVVGQNAVGHAFLYSHGTMTDLGTFGGPSSFGLNINASGQVVGWADTNNLQPNSSLYVTNAFLYSNGTMTNLTPGAVIAGAQGINANGQVVGWYSSSGSQPNGTPLGSTQPFLYSNGTRTNLGSFPTGSDTFPLSINANGQVVGYTYQPGVTGEQPFIYNNGTTTILNTSGDFQQINDSGQAVGVHYSTDTVWNAITYSNGTISNLGTLGGSNSFAYGINNSGQIVGDSTTTSGADHAFIYSKGSMTDLNTLINPSSGWTLTTAFAINDEGQIVGIGTNANGQTDAFLLTPVPEPTSLTLLGIAITVLTCYEMRRRIVTAQGR